MPRHHVPPDVLLTYAAGAASPGEDLLVACHLTLCPPCRDAVAGAESVGTALLDRVRPIPTTLGPPAVRTPEPPPPREPGCAVLPAPLRARTGPLDRVPWRPLGFGVRIATVDTGDPKQRTFLLDFPPAFRIPLHGHRGVERSLVLRGGFRDERDAFDTGDVGWRHDAGHDVRIHPEGRCTTLFVNDGPADVGWLTPLVDWWLH